MIETIKKRFIDIFSEFRWSC